MGCNARATVRGSHMGGEAASVRISSFWNYLPAFIAVAEAGHLRNAARRMRVSPSALSRTIALLEHRIGYHLFERTNRRLRLTSAGERLLLALREGLLLLDDVFDEAVRP
jgi:DNA-binding transcriptional LysR family regulator